MQCLVILIIFLGYISSTESKFEELFKQHQSIEVKMPEDPCDAPAVPMPDFSAPGRSISEVKCLEYTWQIRYEQQKNLNEEACNGIHNIVSLLGGRAAEYGIYPHMSAIGWEGKQGGWIFKCGGSLISEKFVLTAAHCSKVPKHDQTVADQKPKIVRLASKSILDVDSNYRNKPAYDVNIKTFIAHHRYAPPRQYYDIALIELEKKVSFDWRIHPSCLWTKFENPDEGILTGWGVVDLRTRKSTPTLQTAEIKIIDYEICDQLLEKKRNRRWQGFMRHQLCAGDMSGKIDTCQGDSGGPLQTLIPLQHPVSFYRWNLHYIIGVTAFGFGCATANTPSVYTRVASFVGWIENIVWNDTATRSNVINENRIYFNT